MKSIDKNEKNYTFVAYSTYAELLDKKGVKNNLELVLESVRFDGSSAKTNRDAIKFQQMLFSNDNELAYDFKGTGLDTMAWS